MLYTHHGVAHEFTAGYEEYFREDLVDEGMSLARLLSTFIDLSLVIHLDTLDAILYLTLCNDMLHSLRDGNVFFPLTTCTIHAHQVSTEDHQIITIAEDVSGKIN